MSRIEIDKIAVEHFALYIQYRCENWTCSRNFLWPLFKIAQIGVFVGKTALYRVKIAPMKTFFKI